MSDAPLSSRSSGVVCSKCLKPGRRAPGPNARWCRKCFREYMREYMYRRRRVRRG